MKQTCQTFLIDNNFGAGFVIFGLCKHKLYKHTVCAPFQGGAYMCPQKEIIEECARLNAEILDSGLQKEDKY